MKINWNSTKKRNALEMSNTFLFIFDIPVWLLFALPWTNSKTNTKNPSSSHFTMFKSKLRIPGMCYVCCFVNPVLIFPFCCAFYCLLSFRWMWAKRKFPVDKIDKISSTHIFPLACNNSTLSDIFYPSTNIAHLTYPKFIWLIYFTNFVPLV